MPPRSTWKGFLKLSLVSVPVKAFTVVSSGSEIHLNQLHAECNSRIQYKKTCPLHGEVSNDQIVSGYEYSKGQYVVIDPEEIDKLRTDDDKAVNIDTFVAPDTLPPTYLSGKAYYLVPDGPVGLKPYAVIREAMVEQKRQAIARVVLHGKEQLVAIRPIDNMLVMIVLNYDAQVTKPATFAEDVPAVEIAGDELHLARTLIEASTAKKFDIADYKDLYTERLTQLIEAKVAGKELVAPPAHEPAHVINLMEALRQSVAKAQGPPPTPAKEEEARPPKKAAPSRRPAAATEKRKRKSS